MEIIQLHFLPPGIITFINLKDRKMTFLFIYTSGFFLMLYSLN